MRSYLLAGRHPLGLSVPIVGVAVQQRVRGPLLGDIVTNGEPALIPPCTEYQVKQTLTVMALWRSRSCKGASDLGGVDRSVHAVLSALHVWRVSCGDGADYLAALDRLAPIAEAFGVNPVDLFGHLAALAQGRGPVAGGRSWQRAPPAPAAGLGLRTAGAKGEEALDSPGKVNAHAVLRGPMSALELNGVLDQAERLFTAGDPSAADLFAEIAERLDAARFRPRAAIMRRREADVLQTAGDPDDAVIRRVGLA